MKKTDVLKLCRLALLLAVEILMGFTPLGYLNLGILAASLLSIPVAIGAVLLGPMESTALGLCFGLISFYKGFSSTGLMTRAMYSASLPGAFIVTVCGRVLMGFTCGVLVLIIQKLFPRKKTLDCIAGSLLAPLLNTAFFMGLLMLIFYDTEYIQNLSAALGVSNPILLIFAMVGLQAIIEACTCAVIGTAVSRALKLLVRNEKVPAENAAAGNDKADDTADMPIENAEAADTDEN